MPVRQRGDTFQVDVTFNNQRLRQGGFPTRVKAEQWEAQTLDRLRRGVALNPKTAARMGDVTTMQELLDRTYNQFWKGSKAEDTTLANAKQVLTVLGADSSPASISNDDIEFLVSKLQAEGLSGGTINRKLAALSKMLKFGKQRGWVETLPHIQRQREAENRIRWLTAEEEAAVVRWAKWYGWDEVADLVTVLIDTGLRISEALRLTFGDADGGWLRVWSTKNGKPRSVPMTDRVAGIVQTRQRAAEGRQTIFTLDRHQADKRWQSIREKMGLAQDAQFVIHALRHTCASRLVQAGVDLPSVQQVMGHSAITTTMRYAHLAPKNLVNAMQALQGGQPLASAQPALRIAQ